MKKILFSAICVALLAAPVSQAGLVRLDFSGQVVSNFFDDGTVYNDPFSGYFILDTLAPDVRPQANNARYADAIVDGFMTLNGVDYTFTSSVGAGVFVINDNPAFDDLFAALAFFQSADGDIIDFGIQLADMSRTIFDSDAFPNSFSLSDFGPYIPGDYNSTLTYFFGLDAGFDVLGTLNSAELYSIEVSEPAALALLGAGLLAMAAALRRRAYGPGRP